MPKKLYRAHLSVDMYVVAEDEADAEYVAEHEGVNESEFDVYVCEVKHSDIIETEWRNAIPFGEQDEKLVKQYLNDLIEVEKVKITVSERQLQLPGTERP